MVNPVLTVAFDLFLIGSAVAVIAAMLDEHFSSRRPSVGGRGANQERRAPGRAPSPLPGVPISDRAREAA
jgi:hypothetical protein